VGSFPEGGARSSVAKSTDAGTTWSTAPLGIQSGILNRIVVNPHQPEVVYALTSTPPSRPP